MDHITKQIEALQPTAMDKVKLRESREEDKSNIVTAKRNWYCILEINIVHVHIQTQTSTCTAHTPTAQTHTHIHTQCFHTRNRQAQHCQHTHTHTHIYVSIVLFYSNCDDDAS